MPSKKIRLFYVGAFQKHCSDMYRVKGFLQSGLFSLAHCDYRELKKKYGENFSNVIINLMDDFSPDVILINKGELITPEMILSWKKTFPRVIVAYWYGDCRNELENFVIEKLPVVDVFMINNEDDGSWSELWNKGAKDIFFSHTATDLSTFKPYPHIKKKYDIVFFGGNYGNKFKDSKIRSQFISKLAETSLIVKVYGKGWNHLGSTMEIGNPVYGNDFSLAAAEARIILGFNSFLDTHKYTSNRLWNSMACGFHLTHKFNGIEKFFTKTTHLDYFNNYLEMIVLIDHYLKEDKLRDRIFVSGRAEISENHTYKQRAIEMHRKFQQMMQHKVC